MSLLTYVDIRATGVKNMPESAVAAWLVLMLTAFGLSLAMLGLAWTCILYTARNVTKLDLMKGTFTIKKKLSHEKPNPFDLGMLTNFSLVFEEQLWTFWWPSGVVPRNDGTSFPMRPPVSTENFKSLP